MKKNQNKQTSIWSNARRPRKVGARENKLEEQANVDTDASRSVFQQDYDRLLFSTPVRRLADKTQVWPMDDNDGVRTRLTHSHEVANLARSIGARAFKGASPYFTHPCGEEISLSETIGPLLQAIGLGHDLGNPPFGHQGELAIGNWFDQRKSWIFTHKVKGGDRLREPISEDHRSEFIKFDGNPQSIRLLTRLQTHIDDLVLDFSADTLAAGLKYTVSFTNINKTHSASKKGGYFSSEQDIVDWIRECTGLKEGERHPLTWIMEACDDIAYSVLDVDDILKKEIISPDDVLIILRRKLSTIKASDVINKIEKKFKAAEEKNLNSSIERDIKIQYLRAVVIEDLISHASNSFISSAQNIFEFTQSDALMEDYCLCKELKDIARSYSLNNTAVLRAESLGAIAIDGLMTELWQALSDRKEPDKLYSQRCTARSKYVFSLLSPNYIHQATLSLNSQNLRYRELRLLTDMISGMTDSFAVRLWNELSGIPHANST